MIGIFNMTDRALSGIFQIGGLPGINTSREYIMRSSSGVISQRVHIGDESVIMANLPPSEFELICSYSLLPMHNSEGETIYATALGLQRKILGAGAIINCSASFEGDTLRLSATLKGLGVVEFYISDLPRRTISDKSCQITVQGTSFAPSSLMVTVADRVLSLDCGTAGLLERNVESETDEMHIQISMTQGR